MIARQAAVLKRIVDDLLDVSRITRGLIALERLPFDLRSAVDVAIETVMPCFANKCLHIERRTPGPAMVVGDPIRLTQVVTNLLTNACRYTPANGRIQIKTEQLDSEVRVRVRDNGIGIERDQIERVFELFVQGERDLDRREGGLGLGLTIARQLVESHGGKISAASTGAGHGSEFTVTLPAADATGP